MTDPTVRYLPIVAVADLSDDRRMKILSLLRLLAIGSLVVGGGVSGCGGSGGSCGKVQPCGGSPVGNWKIASYCFNSAFGTTGSTTCAGVTEDLSALNETGTLNFGADMSFQQTATVSGAFRSTTRCPA